MNLSGELQIVLWGVVAQWVSLLCGGIVYYMVRIRNDISWKSDVEHQLDELQDRIGGLEYSRRKDDKIHVSRDTKFEKLNSEISSLKENIAALNESNRSLVRSVDKMMDHILQGE